MCTLINIFLKHKLPLVDSLNKTDVKLKALVFFYKFGLKQYNRYDDNDYALIWELQSSGNDSGKGACMI